MSTGYSLITALREEVKHITLTLSDVDKELSRWKAVRPHENTGRQTRSTKTSEAKFYKSSLRQLRDQIEQSKTKIESVFATFLDRVAALEMSDALPDPLVSLTLVL